MSLIISNHHRHLSVQPVLDWVQSRLEPGDVHNRDRFFEKFGIHVRTYQRWQRGAVSLMPVTVERIADAYGTHPSSIHPDYFEAVS